MQLLMVKLIFIWNSKIAEDFTTFSRNVIKQEKCHVYLYARFKSSIQPKTCNRFSPHPHDRDDRAVVVFRAVLRVFIFSLRLSS